MILALSLKGRERRYWHCSYICACKCVCVGVNCVSKIISFKVHGFETLTVADSGGVRGVQMHPPLAASNVLRDLCRSGMQQQPGIVTHSRISSLLISRHLTRPRVASRYSVRTSSATESGHGNPKICRRASHASG